MSLDNVRLKNEEIKLRIIVNHILKKLVVYFRVFVIICILSAHDFILNVVSADHVVSAQDFWWGSVWESEEIDVTQTFWVSLRFDYELILLFFHGFAIIYGWNYTFYF